MEMKEATRGEGMAGHTYETMDERSKEGEGWSERSKARTDGHGIVMNNSLTDEGLFFNPSQTTARPPRPRFRPRRPPPLPLKHPRPLVKSPDQRLPSRPVEAEVDTTAEVPRETF
jgi:hypothetical protein